MINSDYQTIKNVASNTVLEMGVNYSVFARNFLDGPLQRWKFLSGPSPQPSVVFPTPQPPIIGPQLPEGGSQGRLPGLGRPGDVALVSLFPTGNICGNPQCCRTFICAVDYNRNVRPMGSRGV